MSLTTIARQFIQTKHSGESSTISIELQILYLCSVESQIFFRPLQTLNFIEKRNNYLAINMKWQLLTLKTIDARMQRRCNVASQHPTAVAVSLHLHLRAPSTSTDCGSQTENFCDRKTRPDFSIFEPSHEATASTAVCFQLGPTLANLANNQDVNTEPNNFLPTERRSRCLCLDLTNAKGQRGQQDQYGHQHNLYLLPSNIPRILEVIQETMFHMRVQRPE